MGCCVTVPQASVGMVEQWVRRYFGLSMTERWLVTLGSIRANGKSWLHSYEPLFMPEPRWYAKSFYDIYLEHFSLSLNNDVSCLFLLSLYSLITRHCVPACSAVGRSLWNEDERQCICANCMLRPVPSYSRWGPMRKKFLRLFRNFSYFNSILFSPIILIFLLIWPSTRCTPPSTHSPTPTRKSSITSSMSSAPLSPK